MGSSKRSAHYFILQQRNHINRQISNVILFLVILVVYDNRGGKLSVELLHELDRKSVV